MIRKQTLLRLIGTLLVILVLGTGIWLIVLYFSYKNVNFSTSPTVTSFDIYTLSKEDNRSPETKLASQQKAGVIRLKPGSYYITPFGPTISSNSIRIEVKDDTKDISINPYYSKEHLRTTFSHEITGISEIIKNKYPQITQTYEVREGEFYHFGDWYITIMYNNYPEARMGVDRYAVILNKKDDKWTIVAEPKILFSYADHAEIPKDIIDAANNAAMGNQ